MKKYRFYYKKRSQFGTRAFDICCFLFVAVIVSITSLYLTNKDFATELRQVRQPKPNKFYIGIDVSRTIRPDIFTDFKDALISRVKNFIGEKNVSYHISMFGLPGCGKDTIADIVSTQLPEDPVFFSRGVEKRIRDISIARRAEGGEGKTPLTTPLFCFLDEILTERRGERVIIFPDLVNDDSGCEKECSFPLEATTEFGTREEGQIIFLYPTPHATGRYNTPDVHERLIREQKNFIMEMQKLSADGKVRAFFYHIPSYPRKRVSFLRSQLKHSIPATLFEIMWERVSKMIYTIIGAVGG